jgi:conjugal transfer pilus assembly protein TraD
MLVRKYEMPWRKAYEGWAGLIWLLAAAFFVHASLRAGAPPALALPLTLVCLLMALVRASQALRILTVRAGLCGHAMETISTKRLRRLCRDPQSVFLGFGFAWQPVHSQRLYELAKVDFRAYKASPWLLRLMGYAVRPQPEDEMGLAYIHGVEPKEGPLYRPLVNFEGGTCIAGTTQAGKGVALSILISQAIYRGDVVIIFDPKNSKRLKRNVLRACEDTRAPDTFLDFHPAFPERGVRLDPMFNWQKPTELASRIQSIMPPDTSGSFSAFGWDAVNVVVQGMVDLEDRPNLVKLARYIEGGIEPVLEASLRRFFETTLGPHWHEVPQMKQLLQSARRGDLKRPSERTTLELLASVAYYEQHVSPPQRTKVIDAQVRTFRHNREHYQKITANLLPILSMLTSGDLGRSLSPDPFDADDTRPIMNLEKIIRGAHVLYISLDSLPDPAVASAIGAIFLADLAAFAGIRYNLGGNQRISLFVDEVSNVINQPLIEILNKGAEGGIYTTCAMQTLADLARRLGSEVAARMALGNLNNLIALRSKDRPTQDFITETFGKTMIHSMRVGINSAADAHLGDFTAAYSTQLNETLEETVPADVLGKLPNLQYFASVSGGRLIKGRFPILSADDGRNAGDESLERRP